MDGRRVESEIREFYQRWSAMVFTFCRFYLGDEVLGETATARVFSRFLKTGLPLHTDHLLLGLLRCMLETVRHFPNVPLQHALNFDLSHVVLSLPREDRVVFILHGLLGLRYRWIAAVAGVPRQRVQQLWFRSLIRLRRYIPSFEPTRFSQTNAILSRSFVALATRKPS